MIIKVICLVLLTTEFSLGQMPSMFTQFNPIAENSYEPKVRNDKLPFSSGSNSENGENLEGLNHNNVTNDQNRTENNQQQNNDHQQSNLGGKAGDAAKETFQENQDALKNTMNSMMNVGKAHVNAAKDMAETGIKFGTSFPRFGSKLMGQMSDNDDQKNEPLGGFGFFK